MPELQDLFDVLLLRDYNTRLVVLSTVALGVASGVVGTFLLLRKRALLGDALSHATLPGIVLAFMVMVAFGGVGKALPGLLAGAALSGLAGVGAVLIISRMSRLKDDVALGIVLSVFFGLGLVMLKIASTMPGGQVAGLESFIYGKTASMIASDLWVIGGCALLVALAAFFIHKELTILCFDEAFAASQGWPVIVLDVLLMALVMGVTVVGLQAVGLILIIAMLIIPPAAARFWTERLGHMLVVAALIGAISGWLGASASAMAPDLPAGAIIVIVGAGMFAISLVLGPSRGVLVRVLDRRRLDRTVSHQHLLRAMYERLEDRSDCTTEAVVTMAELLPMRSWNAARLNRSIRRALRAGFIEPAEAGSFHLTKSGLSHARRITRNHRLWEMFLITHADIAPSHVDRDADQIEHVLGASMVGELERLLAARAPEGAVPPSPHHIPAGNGGAA